MLATDGGGYVSIQGSVWHRLADTVYCVARKRLEPWRFLHACGMKTVNIPHASAESMSDKTVVRRGWETDRSNRDRLGTRSSLYPNIRNEE
jgi:hypothetical protein